MNLWSVSSKSLVYTILDKSIIYSKTFKTQSIWKKVKSTQFVMSKSSGMPWPEQAQVIPCTVVLYDWSSC